MTLAHAIAAMQLHGTINHILRLVGCKQFCHCRFARDTRCAGIAGPCRAVDEQCCCIYVQSHIRNMSLHHLQVTQGCTEQMTVLRAQQCSHPAHDGQSQVRQRRHSSGRRPAQPWQSESRGPARQSTRRPADAYCRNAGAPTDVAQSFPAARLSPNPAYFRGTRNADRPRAPGASPVRAKST